MGAKCDYRALARQTGDTPRELELVNELLRGTVVRTYRSPVTSNLIVGVAGLGWDYWTRLYERLRKAGLLFDVQDDPNSGYPSYRMIVPGTN